MKPSEIKILGVTVTYNNEDKIPYVMPYYKRIGINKLIVYDNGSTDKTVELLKKYPFVEIRSYVTEQYSEELVLKYKTEVQNEFRGQYDWCISTYFDEVFYSERDFREVLYEKMCEGRTVFVKTGLNIFSRKFPPVDNGLLIHENVGRGSLWTSDDAVVGVYGNKAQLFDMNKVFVNYNEYGCHSCEITGDVSEFEDDIAFFHLKFIDFDFIVRSNEEYAMRMGGNGIACYDYFAENMENVYNLMEKRAISVEKYMSSNMKELVPEQIIFLINETGPKRQIEIMSDLKNASESTIERQFGIIFYGPKHANGENRYYGMLGSTKILTIFCENGNDAAYALEQARWRMCGNYMLEEPWVCETDGSLFKNTKFFSTICQDIKKEALQGYRETIIDGNRFVRYNRFASDEDKVTLGCYMIVKDEAKTIGKCIESIIDFCDEIVVVDTGCADDTMDIARSFGGKIKTYKFDWVNDFSAARNFAMSKISSNYSFTTDADEIFTKELRKHILEEKQHVFNNSDWIDIWLLNYNGTTEPNYYLGGRQIVNMKLNPTWKYKIHEKLYCGPCEHRPINFRDGFIMHKHKSGNIARSNYNKYAEIYFDELNASHQFSNENSVHFYYYMFLTLKNLDDFTAKRYLYNAYDTSKIVVPNEDIRVHLYKDGYISFEEFFVFNMINKCGNDFKYLTDILYTLNEPYAKYFLEHYLYSNHCESILGYHGVVDLAYNSYMFGLVHDFIAITTNSASILGEQGSIGHNKEFIESYIFPFIYGSTLVIDCKNGTNGLASSIYYFSNMFRNIYVLSNDEELRSKFYLGKVNVIKDVSEINYRRLYFADGNIQLNRTTALQEFENAMYDRPLTHLTKENGSN